MPGISKAEHAKLFVEDLNAATEFYTDVMGLIEFERRNDTVYFGCGMDSNYDLAVEEGGTGLDHFAVRVDSEDELDEYAERLAEQGTTHDRFEGKEPGEESVLRFELPSGLQMELVTVEDTSYWRKNAVADTRRAGHTPLDLDHHHPKTTDVEGDARFLEEVCDFKLVDVIHTGDKWVNAFTTRGNFHHDLGHSGTDDPDQTLSHIGWEAGNLEHMKTFIDRLANAGHELEVGVTRHDVGNNIYAYFIEPGGNRFEISTEMAVIDHAMPTGYYDATREDLLTSWGGIEMPASFHEGS